LDGETSPRNKVRPRISIQSLIICILGLLALIPRIILANQLDLVKDEIIYIITGKAYMPLLRHIKTSIGSSGWQINYEHPPLVKILIGLSIQINAHIGHPLNELVAARIPSIIAGVALVVVIYALGRQPFGKTVAFLAALSAAFSPWLAYFSALAYLDMTMTAFITTAYLLTWHATKRPWLYLAVAVFVGLGIDSKYTAALIIPAIVIFTAYYFFVLRLRLPKTQRPPIPWLWWLLAGIAAPLSLLATDPAIWPNPFHQLPYSMLYELNQSIDGHLTFVAGSYNLHIPHWATLYIVLMKVSASVTVPAILFVIFALVQLVRFHRGAKGIDLHIAAPIAFLLIWLVATFSMFSMLTIIVGTHYLLPLVPPVVIAGAYIITSVVRYTINKVWPKITETNPNTTDLAAPISPVRSPGILASTHRIGLGGRGFVLLLIAGIILAGPHLLGLLTTAEAEGYTSIFAQGENNTIQTDYAGYREAVQWLSSNTQGTKRIGLVALPETLWRGDATVSWFAYNSNVPKRLQLQEAHPTDTSYPYDYLVWPMHLTQRGYLLPKAWHIIHLITGGKTTYCSIAIAPYSSIKDTLTQANGIRERGLAPISSLQAGLNLQ
jgi:hypothetical protein